MKNPLLLENLNDRYQESLIIIMDTIREMKIWLRDNWKKVDWSELEILIHNNNTSSNQNKKESQWFGPKYEMQSHVLFEENPVKSFSLVLDPIDMDLSVTINGEEYWWLGGDNVDSLYRYAFNKKNH